MANYGKMTKAELMQRLSDLESSVSGAPLDSQKPGESSALHDAQERLSAILRTAVEGIITIDERGIIESLNPAAETVFGWRASELVGKSVNLLMPSPYREEHDTYIANYLRTGKARIIGIGREVLGRRKDGTLFPMDLAVSELRLRNGRLFVGFIRDIT